METRAKIITRVRKLQRLAHGSTFDNEKQVARRAAQKLIREHHIRRAELEAAESPTQAVVDTAESYQETVCNLHQEPRGLTILPGVKFFWNDGEIGVALRDDVARTPLGQFFLKLMEEA
jgi:hypothetical protein